MSKLYQGLLFMSSTGFSLVAVSCVAGGADFFASLFHAHRPSIDDQEESVGAFVSSVAACLTDSGSSGGVGTALVAAGAGPCPLAAAAAATSL
jgi:hypothetical protein